MARGRRTGGAVLGAVAMLALAAVATPAGARAAASADLVVVARSAPAAVVAGQQVILTLILRNDGPNAARDVRLVTRMAAGLATRSSRAGQGDCRGTAEVACRLGRLPAGAATQVQIVATASAAADGQALVAVATASAAGPPDPDRGNDTATASVVVGLVPAPADIDVGVELEAAPARPRTGQRMTWTLRVTNWSADVAGDVVVTQTVPPGVRLLAVPASCSEDRGVISCPLGALPSGRMVTLVVAAIAETPGPARTTVSVLAAGVDDDPADNLAAASTRVRRARALVAVDVNAEAASVRPGRLVGFAVKLRVLGGAAVDVRVCGRLPTRIAFESAPGASFRRGLACWTLDEAPPGTVRRFRVVGRVFRDAPAGPVSAVATATAANARTVRATTTLAVLPGARGGAAPGVTG